jgi:DNA-binding IscR family transcriptional regulator
LAPFGDADQLRTLIDRDAAHRALYQIFLDVRDAAAKILESTTIADIANPSPSPRQKRRKKNEATLLPMVVHGNVHRTDK